MLNSVGWCNCIASGCRSGADRRLQWSLEQISSLAGRSDCWRGVSRQNRTAQKVLEPLIAHVHTVTEDCVLILELPLFWKPGNVREFGF